MAVDQHKNMKLTAKDRLNNVIPVRLDAAFFFERAVRYLDRHDLRRALKNFRKAVEYEPENAVNHCNLAGVLSELGSYEESNEILAKILQEIDPGMHECYFYMANNYANMGQYDRAEEYVSRYLEVAPDGEFSDEATEMLAILMDEFGGGDIFRSRRTIYFEEETEQDRARRLLEEGRFAEATQMLERLVREFPEETAPRNNLSLAYYYMGDLERALQTAEAVLEQDPHNIHAQCNLAVFYHHSGRVAAYRQMLERLKKIAPLTFDHLFKLATTMGLLGEHRIAKRIFRKLIRWVDRPDPPLLHCYAAALANLGEWEKARRIWLDIETVDPDPDIPRYFIRLLNEAEMTGQTSLNVSYQYHIPFHEQFRRMQEFIEKGRGENVWRDDAFIRSSVFWTLKHGDSQAKLQVLKILTIFSDRETERILQELVDSESEPAAVRKQADITLRNVRFENQRRFVTGGKKRKLATHASQVEAFRIACNKVLDIVLNELQHLEPRVAERAEQMWFQFQSVVRVAPPRMNKPEGWAAALECAVLHASRLDYTQKEIAAKYGVSQSNVSEKFREIMDACFLRSEV
jgi:tetratricopeptide (TPR) repeat protein